MRRIKAYLVISIILISAGNFVISGTNSLAQTSTPTTIPTLPPSSQYQYCGPTQLNASKLRDQKNALDCGVPINAVDIRFFVKTVSQTGSAQVVAQTDREVFMCVLNGVGTFCTYNIEDNTMAVTFDLDCFGVCGTDSIKYDLIVYYTTPTPTPTPITTPTPTPTPTSTSTPTPTPTPIFLGCAIIKLDFNKLSDLKRPLDCGVPINAVNIRAYIEIVDKVGTVDLITEVGPIIYPCVPNNPNIGDSCYLSMPARNTTLETYMVCGTTPCLKSITYSLDFYYNVATPTPTITPGGPTLTPSPTGSDFTPVPTTIPPTVTPPHFDSPDYFPPPTTIPVVSININLSTPQLATPQLPQINLTPAPKSTLRPINTSIGIAPHTPAPLSVTISNSQTHAYTKLTNLLTNTTKIISGVLTITLRISSELNLIEGTAIMITATAPATYARILPREMANVGWRFELMKNDTTRQYRFSDWVDLVIQVVVIPIHIFKTLLAIGSLWGPFSLFIGWAMVMIPIALLFQYSDLFRELVIFLIKILWELYKHFISWIPGVG